MFAFIQSPDAVWNGFTWMPAVGSGWSATVFNTNSGYQIMTDTLTWINCDAPIYSSPWLSLNFHPENDPATFRTDVFLFFPGRTMIHVYGSTNGDFINSYTPTNTMVTLVAIGIKNGKLYSSIMPVSVATTNLTVNFSLQETTEAALTAAINALN